MYNLSFFFFSILAVSGTGSGLGDEYNQWLKAPSCHPTCRVSELQSAFLDHVKEGATKWNQELENKESGHIRIMTWNIHSFRSLERSSSKNLFSEEVRKMKPDILGLLEVPFWNLDDAKALMKTLEFPYTDSCSFNSGFANLLASKDPIEDFQIVDLPRADEYQEGRCLASGKITLGTQSIYVGLTHLDIFDCSAKTRECQVKKLIEHFQSLSGRDDGQVLMGDFNSLLKDELTDAQISAIEIGDTNRGKTTPWFELPHLVRTQPARSDQIENFLKTGFFSGAKILDLPHLEDIETETLFNRDIFQVMAELQKKGHTVHYGFPTTK